MMAERSFDVLTIGGADVDTVVSVDRLPAHDEKVLGKLVGELPGGTAANFACAAGRLGLRVAALASVGDDAAGRQIIADLERFGVDTSHVRVLAGQRSNVTIGLIDPTGEKAMVVVPMIDEPYPPHLAEPLLPQARLLYLMPGELEQFLALARLAHAAGTEVMIDVEAEIGSDRPALQCILAETDIVSFNQGGFIAATGEQPTLAGARRLLASGPHTVVVTRGAHGALAVTRQQEAECPGYRVEVADSTGAGDAFNAAFVRTMLAGRPLSERLRFANAAAALAVTALGPRGRLPTESEVEAFIAQQQATRGPERSVLPTRSGGRMEQSAQNMVAQVESLPELIRGELETLDMRARRLLNHNECLSVKRVVITGCGDSYMAGLAAELAFEQLAGIPTEPMTAMQAARYGTPYFDKAIPRNPLVIGISVSGAVSRTREAVALARREGALTIAVTAHPEMPLAAAAEYLYDCSVPDFPPAPGVRSYRVSLLALYFLAIHLAEVNGRLTQDQANGLRQQLRETADAIEATIAATSDRARRLATAVANHTNFVFTGDGPNYATALFSAAKVIEAAGRHALGQDTEEWAHLQYFVNTDPATPTFIIAPGHRGHDRAAELVKTMRQIGRTVVAVVPADEDQIAGQADWVLPVSPGVPEIFSPMVYAVPGELFAAYLSEAIGEPPFRGFQGVYESDGNLIRRSAVIESVLR